VESAKNNNDEDEIEEWDNEFPLTEEELKDIAASLPIYPPLADMSDVSFVEFLPQMSPDELRSIWKYYKELGGQMDYDQTSKSNKHEMIIEYIKDQPEPDSEDAVIGLVIQAYEELTGEELGEKDLPDEYLDVITELTKRWKWNSKKEDMSKLQPDKILTKVSLRNIENPQEVMKGLKVIGRIKSETDCRYFLIPKNDELDLEKIEYNCYQWVEPQKYLCDPDSILNYLAHFHNIEEYTGPIEGIKK
jgi:hypothetical protein